MSSPDIEQQNGKLLRFEAREERNSDLEFCRAGLLRIEPENAQNDHANAKKRCQDLLNVSIASKVQNQELTI